MLKTFVIKITCDQCEGTGWIEQRGPKHNPRCPKCDGTGMSEVNPMPTREEAQAVLDSYYATLTRLIKCPLCNGIGENKSLSGEDGVISCSQCGGSGEIEHD